MDIYNVLKNGGNRESVIESFYQELEAAENKLKEENNLRIHRETVASAREELVYAIVDYLNELTGNIISDDQLDSLEDVLQEYFFNIEELVFNQNISDTDTATASEALNDILSRAIDAILK